MNIDAPEESIVSSSAATLRRSSRIRKHVAKQSIVLGNTPPKKKAKVHKSQSKKKTAVVDLTRKGDEAEVVNEAVVTTVENTKNNLPTAPATEKRLKR